MKCGDRVEVNRSSKGNARTNASGRIVKIEGSQAVVRLDDDCGGERIWTHVHNLVWVPSQKQIAAACAPIKDRMTPYERRKRSGGMDNTLDPYEVPEVAASSLRLAPVESSAINYGG